MLQNIEHLNSISPLTKLKKPISLVLLFIFYFMHLGFLGVTEGLLRDHWFSRISNICRENQLKVFLGLVNMSNRSPCEFQRTTRYLCDIGKYTAKEFRLILLHVGLFVFKYVLDEDEYNHSLLLHVALRIICSKNLYKKYGPHAQVYFDRFALLGEVIYGLEFVSLSVHSFTHLLEDTQNMDCPASEMDAFPFEDEMWFVKKHIKKELIAVAATVGKQVGNPEPLSEVPMNQQNVMERNEDTHKALFSVPSLMEPLPTFEDTGLPNSGHDDQNQENTNEEIEFDPDGLSWVTRPLSTLEQGRELNKDCSIQDSRMNNGIVDG
ncbi:hypothetical protein QAD02_020336 [Eretmocerus hayati]|uniref:Uncharacterized protein n=1 Tax=Eretmocerus hayati TaxID=131215 RepID=A0ACC2PPL8_9HYME|nr:hypothetical protein QAD02_020336 [Eretmocerus hayati]